MDDEKLQKIFDLQRNALDRCRERIDKARQLHGCLRNNPEPQTSVFSSHLKDRHGL